MGDRDAQVAELIDEIIHMENEHAAAMKQMESKLDFASQIAENALSYSVLLEQAIVVPAVGSIDNYLASSSSVNLSARNLAVSRGKLTASAVASAVSTSERVRQLLDQCRLGPDYGKAKQRREQMLNNILSRGKTNSSSNINNNINVDLEDALVLIECLLEQQQQLGILLADTTKRLTSSSGTHAADTTTSTSASSLAADQQQLRTKEAELAVLQAQVKHLEQLNSTNKSKLQVADEEIARLSKAARSSGAIEELQKHFQQQEERYLQKLQAAEADRESRMQERLAEAARLESMQRVIEDGNAERAVMRAEMDRLRALAVQATGAAAAARSGSGPAFGAGSTLDAMSANSAVASGLHSAAVNTNSVAVGAGEHSLRMELERNIREHSTAVTQLEGEIASLRADLVHAQHEAAGAAAQRTHLDQLHRNNELLRQEIAQLQSRIRSHDTSSLQREADAEKVAVMESTIQQLGDEVTAVDARIRAMHAQHLAERERLQQQLERERSRFQQERDECDALVWRMTSELEFLVKDNALLKAKLEGLQEELQNY